MPYKIIEDAKGLNTEKNVSKKYEESITLNTPQMGCADSQN